MISLVLLDGCGKRRTFLPGAGTCEWWALPGVYVVAQQDESRVSQGGQGMGTGTGTPEAAHCAGGAQGSGLSTRTQEKARQAGQRWAPPNGLRVQLTLHFTVKARGVSGGFSRPEAAQVGSHTSRPVGVGAVWTEARRPHGRLGRDDVGLESRRWTRMTFRRLRPASLVQMRGVMGQAMEERESLRPAQAVYLLEDS